MEKYANSLQAEVKQFTSIVTCAQIVILVQESLQEKTMSDVKVKRTITAPQIVALSML